MKRLNHILCTGMVGVILSCQVMAAADPIAWSLNREFPPIVYSGTNYTITYTLTNHLPFQLINPLNILKNDSNITEFTYTDTCTGARLQPDQSCTVTVDLSPFFVGSKFVQISIAGYDDNVVPLPQVVTYAASSTAAGVIGTVTAALPNTMTAGHSANYIFTFTNYGTTEATNVVASVVQTTGTVNVTFNGCSSSGIITANGGTCTVQGTFVPTSSPSTQTVQATATFIGPTGSPARVSTTTTVNASNALIVGSVLLALPPLVTPNTPYTIEYLFTNVSSGTVTLTNTGTVACAASDSSNCSSNFTTPVSQCTNGSLLTTQACNLTTTFTPPLGHPNITYTLTGSLAYTGTGSPAAVSTAGTEVTTIPTTRYIKMVNNCGFTVWYSLNGAATGQTSSCTPGSTLLNSACWWNNYEGSTHMLTGGGGSDVVTIQSANYNGTQWSGNISASLGCDGASSCEQAACDNAGGSTSCAISKGFAQPATQAEITMLANGADSYDIETINGFHIPISMEPAYDMSSSGTVNVPAAWSNYSCGTPGSFAALQGFGACNWEQVVGAGGSNVVALPSPTGGVYWAYMVGGGTGSPCPTGPGSCASGNICGLNSSFSQVCGKFIGYWTPNEICTSTTVPANIRTALKCDVSTNYNLQPPDQFNNTYTSLMACPVATGYTGPTYNSCYHEGYPVGSNVAQCCGCVNWWDSTQTIGNVSIGANSTATTCPSGQTNTLWTGNIQGGIQWMKQTCPSAYIFPFDDATSTFTCTNNTSSAANTTSYTITFCPGNTGWGDAGSEGRAWKLPAP